MDTVHVAPIQQQFAYLRSTLKRINRRRPHAAAYLIDQQFATSDRIASAYSVLVDISKGLRSSGPFESALARDATACLKSLDLRRLKLPFWWKYGTSVVALSIVLFIVLAFAGYRLGSTFFHHPVTPSTSRFPPNVQDLRGAAVQLGEAAGQAKQGDFASLGEALIGTANYLDSLAHTLGSQQLVRISAELKTAGMDLKQGQIAAAGSEMSKAGSDMDGFQVGGMDFTDAGHAFTEAGRLLSRAANSPNAPEMRDLGIGLANDLLEAREVIMNAASKLEFYEDEQELQKIENSLADAANVDDLLKKMADLGDVLKNLNSHLVNQSLPLMERHIPWQDLTNLEKMTSGWDDTWPSYVPNAKVPRDLAKSPNTSDPALSPEDAKTLFNALTEASKNIASASSSMELMRVKSNPEDLAKIAQDLQAAAMALKESTKLARAISANYISSIKLNVPTSFEDLTMPTATNIGQAWIYQQREPNMGITDLWKVRYVSSYYGSLGIAGDQLGSAGETLGSAFGMWNNPSDIKAMQELKLGEQQLIGASRKIAMTLSNFDELRELQQHANAVESYSSAVTKLDKGIAALNNAKTPEDALKALSAGMQALAEPFSTTPMYKPDAYYLLDQAGRKIGLAVSQSGAQRQAMLNSAAADLTKASDIMFGTQEINLREYGQYLEDIATQLTSTTANTGGQYFLGPLRKVALDFRGLQELLGVQVKWEGDQSRQAASDMDRTLVMGTVLLRPATGDEGAPSPNLMASYYIEAPASAKWPQLKYSGERLAVPQVDADLMQSLTSQTAGDIVPEQLPSSGTDIVRRYFLALAQDGSGAKNWIKKQVPVKPGQPHITVPPLPPDMPPRQPPSTGGGLHCPAVTGSR
ncbi:MAG: hypothetical protein HYX87_03590 [Chloroflexi bacterium]|nr:hypothetical protein [Chloroflexota bacterium]